VELLDRRKGDQRPTIRVIWSPLVGFRAVTGYH